ncbi:class I SAM-dependent methyltransferase [Halobaculum sp. D14]|uniref:class I SAM-dependent methyltransferase n=1 Tax=Halobaculum sp. D14 TaxID=3421642 RepID=UPI003EBC6C0C
MDAPDIRKEWAGRTGEYSPEYYDYKGPDETSERLGAILDDHVDSDAAVLELGCGPGRHLAHLHGAGYRDLHGVEINGDAIDVLRESSPALAADGTFHVGTIEEFVADAPDDRYDVVYSVETLQHLHPDSAWAFADVARVAAERIVTVENESEAPADDAASGDSRDDGSDADPSVNYVDDGLPLYYRNWRDVFSGVGAEQIHSEELRRDTLRVFRAPDA